MRRERLAILVASAITFAATPSCTQRELEPEGHVVVQLDTDAPLPSLATGSLAPIFDAVQLDVLRPDGTPACATCSREIAISREDIALGATITIVANDAALLRVRLFDSALGAVALEPGLVLETVIRLPPRPLEGEWRVPVTLLTDSLGVPQGTIAAPLEPPPRDAVRVRLDALAPEPPPSPTSVDEVCVPGGWFWRGDPRLPPEGELSANIPRLVHVSAFCVDAHEATVREVRARSINSDDLARWSGTDSASDPLAFCPYTAQAGSNEDRAVACIAWSAARAVCQARSADLPTEAQYEWLAKGLGRTSFVWGRDLPACGEAVFAQTAGAIPGDSTCASKPARAILPRTATELELTRDVLRIGERSIVGLAGNLSEWTREAFAPSDDPCAGPLVGVLRDPECIAQGVPARVVVRGGSFTSVSYTHLS